MAPSAEYDPRYLAGIQAFNEKDFFEAHEVWEDLWQECGPEYRRFYQALIQAAVALYHWRNGNWRGARRLFQSGRNYMAAYPDPTLGLATGRFWQQMETALADALREAPPSEDRRLDEKQAPTIELSPRANKET